MVYYSLTEAPHNLKEGIDWLIALKGADAEKNFAAMGAAVHKFLADKPVGSMKVAALEEVKLITKEFLNNPALKEMWPAQSVLRRFNEVIFEAPKALHRWFGDVYDSDYKNVIQTKGLTPETIAKQLSKAVDGCEKFLEDVKHPEQYESSYSSEATWEKSCSEKPEDCAVVLVGIAPMLYAGLRSLKVACDTERLGGVPGARAMSSLGSVLLAAGYQEKQWPTAMTPSHVATALKDVSYQVLVTLYDLAGFWAFYGLESSVPEAEPSAESTLRAKARKFYMGSREVYGIPGVDIDMGLVTAWNSKTYHNKRPQISTAAATGNFQCPGAPTVANLDAASPI